jgi:hypothetical protein
VSESERETHTERVRERGPQWLKCGPIFGKNSPICSEKPIRNLMLLNKMLERGEEWENRMRGNEQVQVNLTIYTDVQPYFFYQHLRLQIKRRPSQAQLLHK